MRKFWEKLEKNQDKMEITYTKILYLKGEKIKVIFPPICVVLGVKVIIIEKKERGGGKNIIFLIRVKYISLGQCLRGN